MVIVIEGPDGAGKTLLTSNLQEMFYSMGKNVLVVREPGTTVAGERIRDVFKNTTNLLASTQLFLIAASRAENTRLIKTTLNDKPDTVILIDRWIHSTIAYQGHYMNLPMRHVLDVLYMTDCFTVPVDILVQISTDLMKEADCAVEETFNDRKHLHDCMKKAFSYDIGAAHSISIHTSEDTTPEQTATSVFEDIKGLLKW